MAEHQAEGLVGLAVDRMIRRSVKRNFHSVWWKPPGRCSARTIFVCNHHGWYDGYLMYHAMTKLQCNAVVWIAEFDAFPPFRFVGGMPFSPLRPMERVKTVRRTIKRMNSEGISLVLFAEGVLHRPSELLPFQRSLKVVSGQVKGAVIVPVGIRYEMSMHERPEAFLNFGPEIPADAEVEDVRLEVKALLGSMRTESEDYEILANGTKDVNERWDVRKMPWRSDSH